MKFGLFSEFELGRGMYDQVTGLYGDYIKQACFAEEQGFESVWVLEHHFTDLYSYCSAPEILLTSLAAHTSRVRLGCGVCLLPYHNPVTVAERYATLDHLSNGRLEFGIGRGVPTFEWNKFRAEPFEAGRDIMYEALDVVLKCWTGEDFVHEGKYFRIDKAINVIPKPMQKPHPRIHAAITSPDSAAVYGAKGWETMSIARVNPFDEITHLARNFRAARLKAGGGGEFSVLVDIHCAATDREADERFSVYHKWFFTEMGRTYYPMPQAGAPAEHALGQSDRPLPDGPGGLRGFQARRDGDLRQPAQLHRCAAQVPGRRGRSRHLPVQAGPDAASGDHGRDGAVRQRGDAGVRELVQFPIHAFLV